MIIRELFLERKDGVKLYRIYSDENRMLIQEQTGIEYEEAIDVEDAGYTYIEGDIIEEEVEEDV